jgi:hypothetical protein
MVSQAATALLATRQPWVPDWPVIRPGLVMTYLGPHLLLLMDDGMTAKTYREFLDQLTQLCANVDLQARGASIIHYRDSQWWRALSLNEKSGYLKEFMGILSKNETQVRTTVPVAISVTDSLLVARHLAHHLCAAPAHCSAPNSPHRRGGLARGTSPFSRARC